MHHVLDSLAGDQIKTITIATMNTNDPRDFIGIYQSLARLSSLWRISHTWGYGQETFCEWPGDADGITVDIVSIIYPVSRLIHLECLEFSFWNPFMDDDISALAIAFPTLKELSISSRAIGGQPTFNSLCILASTCPNLTWLTISLDAKTIPSSLDYNSVFM